MINVTFARKKSEFDIFPTKPAQTAILETRETLYKPIVPIDQNDLEFVIPGDNETYTDLNIHIYVRGKLMKTDRTDFDTTDHSTFINSFLHSLFNQCSVTPNGLSITSSEDLYHYRAHLERLLTCGHFAATSHLTNAI
jgi:hypothetical protein